MREMSCSVSDYYCRASSERAATISQKRLSCSQTLRLQEFSAAYCAARLTQIAYSSAASRRSISGKKAWQSVRRSSCKRSYDVLPPQCLLPPSTAAAVQQREQSYKLFCAVFITTACAPLLFKQQTHFS
jgi:hypothetical protein